MDFWFRSSRDKAGLSIQPRKAEKVPAGGKKSCWNFLTRNPSVALFYKAGPPCQTKNSFFPEVLMSTPADPGQGSFSTTHWSVILQAREEDAALARAALETLCGRYWFP